jgi:transposase, IS5 family
MSQKSTGQLNFAEAFLPGGAGRTGRLDQLSGLVKWYRFEKLLKGQRDPGPGRPGYRPVLMFKALLLQSLYGLSDAELEDALCDRLSFRRFVGLGLGDDVPDHTTLCRFRNGLVASDILAKLFAELDRQLEQAGIILRRGTMLDATLIETTAARPPMGQLDTASDPDARFVRHQGKRGSVYGYKAHVGVDEGSGIIRSVITTPANVNDTTPADQLLRGDEKIVWGDSAYHTHAREKMLKAGRVKVRLMRRPNKHHPALSPRLARYNRLISKTRATVETTFATLKNRMGLRAIRYRGLVKATAQITLAAMAFNLRRWVRLAPAP